MCGIVGYIGNKEAVQIVLSGLKELEYRGYDSAGLAVLGEKEFRRFKSVGKLENLAAKVGDYRTSGCVTAIGHTRWATHGKPTENNAHPHGLSHSQVVHNGIIENYVELRSGIQTPFLSQTDSEVIVHLFENFCEEMGGLDNYDSPLSAFRSTLSELHGSYAILLITAKASDRIFFARKGSPLQIGFSEKGCFFASSDAPLLGECESAIHLEDGQWGVADFSSVRIFDEDGASVAPKSSLLPASRASVQKEGHRFFMEKEIHEQPQVLADILTGRLRGGHVGFEEMEEGWITQFSSATICACGTSYHAALVASYLLERLAQIPVKVEIASEFRYRNPFLDPKSLFIVISQSGETADTLEALKMANCSGLTTLALCNTDNSSIVREATRTLLLRAGIEKGVASTKAFAAQVMTLWLVAIYWSEGKGLLVEENLKKELDALRDSIEAVKVQPHILERIQRLSKRYLHGHGFFFIGRDIFYPLALEGALKLKEISYLHAEGYPAGEMKHGPIALADPELFTIALMARSTLYDKMKSNVQELSARESTILAITTEYFELADDIIEIRPYEHPMLEFFEMMTVVQLLAMEISIRLGNDVDMPRNLAKSVTVE